MLESSLRTILERLDPDDVVLDVGAWWRPFTRADWAMDLMPYETRAPNGHDGPLPERFTRDTWVQRDICDRTPFPFGDDEIDFVVCSHTLEDVRDPIWVCSEMVRVAKAGYIEVPSRLEEQCYGVEGPWVGRSHHRWLIDMDAVGITFTSKSHMLHRRRECHFPYGFDSQLEPADLVQSLSWEGSFDYTERFFASPEEHDRYLAEFVAEGKKGRRVPSRTMGIVRLVLDRARVRRWGRPRSSTG